ncbi:hypothetical protein EAI_10168 [Harpegnathos saltator]|uniref:Uncharacterized protein n=1 Tax=Harpegnathos saltator TaxID=610380 RepID=E2BAQ6_HARSA|nr:hypothetical protein EAI_10168 [Harpegnathos saltator]
MDLLASLFGVGGHDDDDEDGSLFDETTGLSNEESTSQSSGKLCDSVADRSSRSSTFVSLSREFVAMSERLNLFAQLVGVLQRARRLTGMDDRRIVRTIETNLPSSKPAYNFTHRHVAIPRLEWPISIEYSPSERSHRSVRSFSLRLLGGDESSTTDSHT